VANRVRGDAAKAQRRAVGLSALDVQLKPLLNPSPSHRPTEAIGQQRLIWLETRKLQPSTDVVSGFLPIGAANLDDLFAGCRL
jgi:hypothetical protein